MQRSTKTYTSHASCGFSGLTALAHLLLHQDCTWATSLTHLLGLSAGCGRSPYPLASASQVADPMRVRSRGQYSASASASPSPSRCSPGASSINWRTSVGAFAYGVVPILQERGIYPTDYEGTTLRDHLGVPSSTDSTRASQASDGGRKWIR